VINVRTLEPGTRVALTDGSLVEVMSNPRDGIWLFGRYLACPRDASMVGTEEMIFAQDVAEISGGA
jgi:hypothetical protein